MAVRIFRARGNVQGVMFRQTVVRGAEKRGLRSGASNSRADRHDVTFTLEGDDARIDEVITFMESGEELNDWGATVAIVVELDEGPLVEDHQVHSGNVNQFNWNPNVVMYL